MRKGGEHTPSYYAATENYATRYRKLYGEHRCDVVVVGGGFTGVSAAKITDQMGIDGRDIVVDRIRKYSIDCDLKFGFIEFAMKESEVVELESRLRRYPRVRRCSNSLQY